jgi:hypothetical protein
MKIKIKNKNIKEAGKPKQMKKLVVHMTIKGST